MSPICWLLSHSTMLSFLFFITFFIPNHHAFTSIISGRRRSSSLSFVTTTKTMIPTKEFPLSDQRRSTTTSSLVRLYSSFRPDSDNDDGEKKNDDNDETNNSNYYDDFGDFVIGDGPSSFISSSSDNSGSGTPSSSPSMSSSPLLQERMNKLIQQERQWQEQISQNWKLGQWSVRGCSLDPYSSSSDEAEEATKIQISSLCALPICDDDDDDGTAADIVLVGRTDGSLCWLQLGGPGDYLATFTQQLVAKDAPSNDVDDDGITDGNDDDNNESTSSSSLGGMIVSQELKREGQPQQTASFSNTNNPNTTIVGYDDNTPNINYNKNSFEILAQLPTVSTGPIRNMKIIEDVLYYIDDSQPNKIFQLSNSVSSFLQEQQQQQQKTSSSSSLPLDEIHTSPIISLLTHSKDTEDTTTTNTPVMVSISDNGQVVFWKQTTGNMVPFHQLQIPFQSDNSVVLSCDIDSDYLYFGDSNGILYVYSNHYHNEFDSNDAALLEQQQQQQPLQIFQAFSNGGISALCAAGESSMGTGGRVLTTRTIIAGSTRGEIRQWELIPRNNNSGSTAGVEFWPRLASQTIPGKAHIFDSTVSSEQGEGASFSAASSTILSLRVIEKDNVILSANANEIQFWDPKSGKLHFDMQGLEFGLLPNYGAAGVACEILKDASLMVTNGMGQYVCVHDFTIDPSTVESFLELDDTDDDY